MPISPDEFRTRREALCEAMGGEGTVLLLGHEHAGTSYPGNPYPFRQESSFRYLFGLDEPDAAGIIDCATGTATLYGHEPDLDSVIWDGDLPPLAARVAPYGTMEVAPNHRLDADVASLGGVHTVPATRGRMHLRLGALGIEHPSRALIEAIVRLRERKSPAELAEITDAVNRASVLHHIAFAEVAPGRLESDVVQAMGAAAASRGWATSYSPVFSVRGEVLHNPHHHNELRPGDLIVHDGGVSSEGGYASDITRTIPVSGTFTAEQRVLYEIVLAAHDAVIDSVRPGVPYREMHDLAGRAITEGLTEHGWMRGDIDESVAAGAFAAFLPHGVGHMLGLDVHDMEGIGEDHVGYDADHRRSERFGIANLRLGKPVEEGFVMTVEPGIYRIPPLLERLRSDQRIGPYLDVDRALASTAIGGIRIEDVITVGPDGGSVLGDPIPSAADEVEALVA
ncbi:MAG: M24 family metallopeptidase [Acidimicrobiia bacterium]|nr:M24 family metallopeptidase [Acidimicrobiia bacterium]